MSPHCAPLAVDTFITRVTDSLHHSFCCEDFKWLLLLLSELFTYLFLAVLGLCCYMGFSLVAVRGLLIAVVSLVLEHRL